MKSLIIGCGRMGSAIVRAIVKNNILASGFSIIEPELINDPEIINSNIKIFQNINQLSSKNTNFDLVIIAVKPQTINEVVQNCKKYIKSNYLLISIAAGVKINFFESFFGTNIRVIRAMPNTPAEIGQGITGLIKSSNVNSNDIKITNDIFGSLGEKSWIDDEELMDIITAISGSGPAYIFYFAEALIKVAIQAGLAKDEASKFVSYMIKGSGFLLSHSGKSAIDLREEVTSPGGTTEAALKVLLKDSSFKTIISNAVLEAIKKSKEISDNH